MSEIVIQFFGYNLTGHGGSGAKFSFNSQSGNLSAPQQGCFIGNSNLDAICSYDQTFGYLVQQEGKQLAVAAIIYAQAGTRSGPPAGIKVILPPSQAIDNPSRLVSFLFACAEGFEQNFIKDGVQYLNGGLNFYERCEKIIQANICYLNSLTLRDVTSDSTHRLNSPQDKPFYYPNVEKLDRPANVSTGNYRGSIARTAVRMVDVFQNEYRSDQLNPVILLSPQNASYVKGAKIKIVQAPEATSAPDKKFLTPVIETAISAQTAAEDEFKQAAAQVGGATLALIQSANVLIKELGKIAANEGPDGHAARAYLRSIKASTRDPA